MFWQFIRIKITSKVNYTYIYMYVYTVYCIPNTGFDMYNYFWLLQSVLFLF